ncbi:acyl-phosphate glycerol 3-phosphate acyltransferase [Neobacillus piezotolerans]|uniref:Glycerol-3-phosphate acyltransferase n=1 Tax=Neobacillus piezotolerans TaxID=2259171 RepID=A0A3D8GQ49_9BACI|nr:glycerol-3-phosphate 1-O-acyltransferase PlsY [Neobacillus piezotolerans]RDU36620.1 acyl-phosphate glycerol 3-phosphate acyltransferase [Neobacillus piezotolerans]
MLAILTAYLIGSIPTALIVGKLIYGVDIREHGSNNPGATNTLRVMGKRAALFVLAVDAGKGALAASIPIFFPSAVDPLYLGMAAVIGHCFPIFAGFRGGKAIATTAGALLATSLPMFLAAYLAFIIITYATKYVFFGSISVGLSLFIYSLILPVPGQSLLFGCFTIFLIYLHRSNIRNLILGIEPKINDKSIKKDRIPPNGSRPFS